MIIALAQINTTIGDFDGNCAKIIDRLRMAEREGADIVLYPELTICGYPPRDLLEKPDFVKRNLEAVERVAKETKDTAAVIGYVFPNKGKEGRALFNSAGLLQNGKLKFVQNKTLLPEYDVFDEVRHFEPAKEYGTCRIGGKKIGLSMCEDIWSFYEFKGRRLYHVDPIRCVVDSGADVVLNLSASPFTLGKREMRLSLVSGAAKRFRRPVVYCNMIGGNDELVFDGKSFVIDGRGRLIREAKAFEEDFFIVDLEKLEMAPSIAQPAEEEEILSALVLGLKDYMRKCGFEKVVIGLSGGIDSAVVAAVACRAIGGDKVMGVMMPSPYSSKESVDDAVALAKNLGIVTRKVPIGDIYASCRKTMEFSDGTDVTVAEENIQARVRGTILMTISNQRGALVLSTGNKSELSVGYCTLYGDMAGGLALISDIPKTTVFALARHINKDREIIPRAIIEKKPSAELKPNQTDTDTLPPYEILDPISRAYVEDRMDIGEIVSLGFARDIVERIVHMIDRNEYKRRQSAPGIKVTSKAFGFGRRFPIAWKP